MCLLIIALVSALILLEIRRELKLRIPKVAKEKKPEKPKKPKKEETSLQGLG
jgi:biopolymer transport protein ExbD